MIRRPLFVCAGMLSFGILSAVYLKLGIPLAIVVSIALFCISCFSLKKKITVLAAFFSLAFLLGNICCNIQNENFKSASELTDSKVTVLGEVSKFETKTYSTYVYLEKAIIENKNYPSIIVKISNEEIEEYGLKIGNRIKVCGTVKEFNEARNLGNFDEESYYHSLGVAAMIKEDELTVVSSNINIIEQGLYELKCKIVDSFESSVSSSKSGIFSAIVAGDKSEIEEDTKELYQDSGIAHILAISGLHISLIGMGIFGFLRKKFKYLLSAVLSIIFMIAFCIMSGASVSALRATIMFIISLIAIGKGKKYDILTALSLSAIITLVANPHFITNTGFLMSYAAIVSIGFINKYAEKFILPKHRLSKSFIASISITFFSIPLVASTYFQIPLYSVFLNLIVIPLMSFVLGSGLVSGFFGILSIAMGRFFIGMGIYAIYFIEGCSSLFLFLPFSIITTGKPTAISVIIFYFVLAVFIALCIWLYSVDRKTGIQNYIAKMDKQKRADVSGNPDTNLNSALITLKCSIIKFTRRKALRVIVSALILLILLAVITGGTHTDNLRIVMFDVDQGDGILIQNTNGHVYMIDGGSTGVNEVGKYRLKSGIKYFGINTIDYEIVTHPDTDHISGLMELIEDESSGRIRIKNVLIPYLPENENYCQLITLCEENNINVINISAGMGFDDGDLHIKCLHPAKDFCSDDVNSYSTVLDLSYGDFNGLFVGDIGAEVETLLADKDIFDNNTSYEILKVAHHGSKNSSTLEFLNKVCPETALISAGVDNSYGHPSAETIDRLKSIGADIYVTAECGEIIIEAEKNGKYSVETALK